MPPSTAGGEMDGVRVLGTETVAYALAVVVDGEWDQALGGPVRRCLGFNLSGLHEPVAWTPGTDKQLPDLLPRGRRHRPGMGRPRPSADDGVPDQWVQAGASSH